MKPLPFFALALLALPSARADSPSRKPAREPLSAGPVTASGAGNAINTEGFRVPGAPELWWCGGGAKVARAAALAQSAPARALELSLARNEYEGLQLVLSPQKTSQMARIEVSDLKSAGGQVLPAKYLAVRQVEYVRVAQPTDQAGAEGLWPDPLPPQGSGRRAPAGRNTPFLITAYAPPGQAPGVYRGQLLVGFEYAPSSAGASGGASRGAGANDLDEDGAQDVEDASADDAARASTLAALGEARRQRAAAEVALLDRTPDSSGGGILSADPGLAQGAIQGRVPIRPSNPRFTRPGSAVPPIPQAKLVSPPGDRMRLLLVPITVRVRAIVLPREPHVRSGFGLDASSLWAFHNVSSAQDRQEVWDKYLEALAAHRMAPFNPLLDAPITVGWGLGQAWQGGARDESQHAEGAASLRVEDNSAAVAAEARVGASLDASRAGKYVLSYAIKTALPGQKAQLTLLFDDAEGKWISGRNFDLTIVGDGSWQKGSVDFSSHLTPEVKGARLLVRPVEWSEAGAGEGTAWFDEISVLRDGQSLLSEGFEAQAQARPEAVKVNFSRFDAQAERVFKRFGFNSFSLRLEGLGGGTFFERHPGRIGPFEEGSPEYESLLGAYLRAVSGHLKARGWLDKAYVYWFDEPGAPDYAFVRATNERIHRLAPGLKVLLTEHPEPALGSSVDIWCPVTSSFDASAAKPLMDAGREFWWYLCTNPRWPHAGLFLDRASPDLRLWGWQTWQQKVSGVLVWETAYWSSSTAYPDARQNPWRDTMSWAQGNGLAPAARSPWGNGDGRLFYPPSRRGAPAQGSPSKYLGEPVSSLRLESLRDGLEDYEYLWLLRQSIEAASKRAAKSELVDRARALLEVPPQISADATHFTLSERPMLEQRDKIAGAIEALDAARPKPLPSR